MKDESSYPGIDPEMEARIMKFVLGTCSNEEARELETLIGEKEELQLFREQIQDLHEMLCAAGREEPFDEAAWKLPDEKRERLIGVLGSVPENASPSQKERSQSRGWQNVLIQVAACLVLGLGVLFLFLSAAELEHSAGAKYGREFVVAESVKEYAVDSLADSESMRRSQRGGQIELKSSLSYSGKEKAESKINWDTKTAGVGGSNNMVLADGLGSRYGDTELSSAGVVVQVQSEVETEDSTAPLFDSNDDLILQNGQVKIDGNEQTKDHVVRRELPLEPGVPSTPAAEGKTRVLSSLDADEFGVGYQSDFLFSGTSTDKTSEAEPSEPLRKKEMPSQPLTRGRSDGNGADGGIVEVAGDELHLNDERDRRYAMIGHGGTAISEPVSGTIDASGGISGGQIRVGGNFEGAEVDKGWINMPEESNRASLRESVTKMPVINYNGTPPERSQLGFEIVPELKSSTEKSLASSDSELAKLDAIRPSSFARSKSKSDILHAGVSLSVGFGAEEADLPIEEDSASEKPFSTFSLHVSDVSFKLAHDALSRGQLPEPDKVRIEEFVNAFDYGDPAPGREEKVSSRVEQVIHPFLQQRNLLRVAIRTAAAGRDAATPLQLTILLDNSGSMERADRREILRRAMLLLTSQLRPGDRISLISFARKPRLLADRVAGDSAADLVKMIENLPSEGGTNLEAALELAFEKAREQKVAGAQNRIVLLTDGAANLGDADPEVLARRIETMRLEGIAFDAAGIGAEGLNDEILEALTRKGDGRYYLLGRPEDADAGFAAQLAGAFRPAAGNVKVQLEFNPERVGNYKLLGFEKHRLKKEDFRNDKVDAAELAAEEAGVAVYQIEPKADGEGDIGSVSVRFRDMTSGKMVEQRWPILYQPNPPHAEKASDSMRLATVAALFGAKCERGALGGRVELSKLSEILEGLSGRYRDDERVQQLRTMLNKAREIESF